MQAGQCVTLWLLLLLGFSGTYQVLAERSSEQIVSDEINTYLADNVKNSNDAVKNLAKLKEWWQEIAKKYQDEVAYRRNHGYYGSNVDRGFTEVGSAIKTEEVYDVFNKTMTDLMKLPRFSVDRSSCGTQGREFLKDLEVFLATARVGESGNLPYRRFDRILEHFATTWVDNCQNLMVNRPDLRYIFKSRAYNEINDYLIDNVSSDDIELNMAKVNERLDSLVRDQIEEGVLTDALRQLAALKSVVDEKMCNFRAYEILLKNDLATGGSAHTNKLPPIRRIDKIVNHYAAKHAQICLPIYKQKVKTLIQTLDKSVRHNLLVLTSTYLLAGVSYTTGQDNKTVESAIDEDKFYIPSVENLVSKLEGDQEHLTNLQGRIFGKQSIQPDTMRQYLTQVAKNDSNFVYLDRFPDERTGEYVVSDKKVKELFDTYLLSPCRFYVDKVTKEVYRLLWHDELVSEPKTIAKEDLKNDSSFYIGRATNELCRTIVDNATNLTSSLIESIPRKPGRDSIKDSYIVSWINKSWN